MSRPSTRAALAFAVLAFILAACGGGGGGAGPTPPNNPTPTAKATATPTSTPSPAPAYTSFAIPYGANSLPAWITAGPNSDLWFSLATLSAIGRIGIDGSFGTLWKVPVNTSINSLVTGPDKKLWYGDERQIVQLDQATGTTTKIDLGNMHNVFDLIVGPDDKLWWADGYGFLSSMPASIMGIPTSWSVPANENGPQYLTVGPDRNIWLVEGASTSIGARVLSFTTTGVKIIDAPLPNDAPPLTGSLPWDPTSISTGSDGNIWISEAATNSDGSSVAGRVLKVSTGGSNLGTFDYKTSPGESVSSLTSAPNGLLYAAAGFTVGNGFIANFSIGIIDPRVGGITVLSTSPQSGPFDLTLGPDGNIWTTNRLGNSISRLAIH